MKYKVGDRVNTIGPVGVGTIVGTKNDGRAPYLVSLDDWAGRGHMGVRARLTTGEPAPDSSNWWFNERCLTLITPEAQSIHITTDGTTTHAVLKDGKSVVKRSKAVCAPSDVFDFETGARVAFDRLISPGVLEVKRRAKVGEYIQIVDAFVPDGYKNGDVLKVLGLDGSGEVKGTAPKTGIFIRSDEYVVLEGYQPEEEPIAPEEPEPELPKFTYKAFNKRGDLAVNCTTQEDADIFCAYLHGKGDKWCDGDSYLTYTKWNEYEGKTCYYGDGTYGSKSTAEKSGRTVIPFNKEELD